MGYFIYLEVTSDPRTCLVLTLNEVQATGVAVHRDL